VLLSGIRCRLAGRAVLDDLDLRVEPGEVVGLVGENGAGKSTTLRIALGLLAPDAGRVELLGRPLIEAPREARSQVGYLAEGAPLPPDSTVRQLLLDHAQLRGGRGVEARCWCSEALTRLGLESLAERIVGRLSRGQRQRVGLALALLGAPPLLILDEPTEGLDPVQRTEVLALLRRVGRAGGLLLSTHVVDEAEQICDRRVVLARGRVVAVGQPRRLEDRQTLRLEVRGARGRLEGALRGLPGVRTVCWLTREPHRTAPLALDGGATDGTSVDSERLLIETDGDVREEVARAVVSEGALLGLEVDGGIASLLARHRSGS
jgi:ABC-2 type transport system ATP-binding protein